jgi:hypothetical protein
MASQSQSWSSLEVEAVVADYFHMLTLDVRDYLDCEVPTVRSGWRARRSW